MTNLSFSNKSFQRTVKQVRKIMPALAVILLIAVYAVSAIAEGIFLASLMTSFAGGAWLAYGISGAIQATRGLLVFFPQLNPNRPTFGLQGEVIAVVMGLISIASIWGVVSAVGLPDAVGVSLSILMAAGIGVEIFFLREIKYATEQELFSNREYWEEIRQFAQAKKELQVFLDGLQDYDPAPAAIPVGNPAPTPSEAAPAKPEPKSRTFSNTVLDAIGAADNLTEKQMQTIRNAIDQGRDEETVIWMIRGFSENKRQERAAQKDVSAPLDLAGLMPEFWAKNSQNGNGQH